MSATILDGKALAASIKKDLAVRVIELKKKGITPGLGTVLVGDDPGSHSYVGGKHRDCQEVGVTSVVYSAWCDWIPVSKMYLRRLASSLLVNHSSSI